VHWIDFSIFGLYMLVVLGIGLFYFRRNTDLEDYYLGSRSMKASHVGLSIVATDVGGGFSIGLGGVGFLMGFSGSWLLFTGLVGAWLSAVFIIPRIKKLDRKHNLYTYPDFLRLRYDDRVALAAAVISGIGYLAFTGAQVLAGAKLASATLISRGYFGLSPLEVSLVFIAIITILYTVLGGLKAVIYTDTVQWIILMGGLVFFAIPFTVFKLGGWSILKASLPAEFFTLTNITPVTFINWMVTIIPIWLIGMTLYQRMFACRNEDEARKAWYIAGFFEYPVMAFVGVFLGMCSRVLFPNVESEMGLPLLLKECLPIGITGIVIASYFSAIMSTADSCLMASSGNFVNDILEKYYLKNCSYKRLIRISQIVTFLIGVIAVVIAARFEKVLDVIMYAYAFMVSGLFVPTLAAYFWKRASAIAALWSMVCGGSLTVLLQLKLLSLPHSLGQLGLNNVLYGLILSALILVIVSFFKPNSEDSIFASD
jgi:solute:Na+ symporter, SSS family